MDAMNSRQDSPYSFAKYFGSIKILPISHPISISSLNTVDP